MNDFKKNLFLRGTIYDDVLWPYFVNFGFFEQAVRMYDYLLKTDITKTNIAIPLTPTAQPVLIQVLTIERGIALKKHGCNVVFVIRDLGVSEQQACKLFMELLEKRFRKLDFEPLPIYRVTSFEEQYSADVRRIREKLEQWNNDLSGKRNGDPNEKITPLKLPVFQELILDALSWLIATRTIGSSLIYLGQIEAYPTEYARGILNQLITDTIPSVVYLPELWLFAGTHVYLNDSRDTIMRKLMDSQRTKFRSVAEYSIHIKALDRLVSERSVVKTPRLSGRLKGSSLVELERYVEGVSERLDRVLSTWREL